MPQSTKQFEKLEEFKKWMQTDYRKHCEEKYGRDLFADFIFPYYNDFMECVEYHIEDLADQSIQDEELAYDEQD